MSGKLWTDAEIKKLRSVYNKKPQWMTDYELAGHLAPQFAKSPESVRWQLRQFHKTITASKPPKILILDIETLPIEALVWDVWKQDIHTEQVEKDWSILCYSAKWLFDTNVMGRAVTAKEAKAHQDKSILPEIWNLMNEAQIVVTHNGDSFDIKRLNTRFWMHGLPKPMYYQSIDTLKIAKDNFSFTYNKLDWIAQIIGVGRKVETEFKWWAECHNGNQEYIDLMLEYNKHDVNLEEEVYLKLRPWMDKHPNMNVHTGMVGNLCPTCGSANLHWKGTYATALGLYKAFRCEDCGAIGRSTKKAYKLNASEVQ